MQTRQFLTQLDAFRERIASYNAKYARTFTESTSKQIREMHGDSKQWPGLRKMEAIAAMAGVIAEHAVKLYPLVPLALVQHLGSVPAMPGN